MSYSYKERKKAKECGQLVQSYVNKYTRAIEDGENCITLDDLYTHLRPLLDRIGVNEGGFKTYMGKYYKDEIHSYRRKKNGIQKRYTEFDRVITGPISIEETEETEEPKEPEEKKEKEEVIEEKRDQTVRECEKHWLECDIKEQYEKDSDLTLYFDRAFEAGEVGRMIEIVEFMLEKRGELSNHMLDPQRKYKIRESWMKFLFYIKDVESRYSIIEEARCIFEYLKSYFGDRWIFTKRVPEKKEQELEEPEEGGQRD